MKGLIMDYPLTLTQFFERSRKLFHRKTMATRVPAVGLQRYTYADYGKVVSDSTPVWRAGANQTTKLKTEVPLEIGGKRLAPGEYDLFVDLKEPAWTLIVSMPLTLVSDSHTPITNG